MVSTSVVEASKQVPLTERWYTMPNICTCVRRIEHIDIVKNEASILENQGSTREQETSTPKRNDQKWTMS